MSSLSVRRGHVIKTGVKTNGFCRRGDTYFLLLFLLQVFYKSPHSVFILLLISFWKLVVNEQKKSL